MIKKLTILISLLALSSLLLASEVVWDGRVSGISQSEYNKAIKEYVDKTYPKKVKMWERERRIKRERERREREQQTTKIGNLIWQDNIDTKSNILNWNDAKKYCANLSLVGWDDWYLPNINKLKQLYQNKGMLKNVASNSCWSSSEYADGASEAWIVNFYYGDTYWDDKSDKYFVRCVRGRQ